MDRPHPPTPSWNGSLTGFPLGLCVGGGAASLQADLCYTGQSKEDVINLAKVYAALDLLCSKPEAVDLSVELEGERRGMLSAAQPQRLVTIKKAKRTTLK